jgi:hypothetical protein
MIIYDGKYSWSGKKHTQTHPVSWWAGAYRLKIIDLAKSSGDVLVLKPIVVIVSDTGEGASATNCAPELVKSVCRDFKLDIQKLIWVEYQAGPPPHMDVAKFKPVTTISNEMFYQTAWRAIRPTELAMIKPFSPEARQIIANHL